MNLYRVATAVVICFCSSASVAANLKYLYELALDNDPTLHAAKQDLLSSLEAKPQAIADLLPSITTSASTVATDSTVNNYGKYNINKYSLSLSQPIVNYDNWVEFAKSLDTVKSARNTYRAAEQDLLIRIAERYFNVLKAIDNLKLATAKHKAFSRALEQTNERFKVGLIAITDVHDSQARKDNAYAEKIAAKNSYEDQKEILREIVGKKVSTFSKLNKKVKLLKPEPNNINTWVEKAIVQNYTLLATKDSLNATKKDITKTALEHLPTLSLDGSITNTKNFPNTDPTRTVTKEIGLTISLPIFSGGKTLSKQRQAMYDYRSQRESYNETLRAVKSTTRQSFRGVLTQISRVKALKQAVISNESALKATRAAYDVGTRTIVDLLNAESDLLTARRNYQAARYDYLLETLKLKQAVGSLVSEDLIYINSLLVKNKK